MQIKQAKIINYQNIIEKNHLSCSFCNPRKVENYSRALVRIIF